MVSKLNDSDIILMHEIVDNVWLGSLKAASDTTWLKENQITHMLSLGVVPHFVSPEIEHKIINIDDNPE